MNDEILDLLREFRSDGAEPSQQARAQAEARIAAHSARPRLGSALRVALRRRIQVAAAVGLTTVATAAALLLLAPWSHGPGALTSAQASVVLKRVVAKTSPRPGWIFHERTVTLTPARPRLTSEAWRQDAPPYRFRSVSRWASDVPLLEIGGTRQPARVFVYDGGTRKLYRNPPQVPLHRGRYQDQAALLRQQLEGTLPMPRGARWQVASKTTLDGRPVYKLVLVFPPPVADVGLTYYVDAKSYVPVQIVNAAAGDPSTKQVTYVTTYEYVRPTPANVELSDIQAQHAHVPVVPGTRIPPRVLEQLGLR